MKADDYDKSNALLSDVILNYRTVISFGQKNVDQINEKYEKLLEAPQEKKIRNYKLAGLASGWAVSGRTSYVAVCFLLGYYITVEQLGVSWMLVVCATFILFFAFMSVGG